MRWTLFCFPFISFSVLKLQVVVLIFKDFLWQDDIIWIMENLRELHRLVEHLKNEMDKLSDSKGTYIVTVVSISKTSLLSDITECGGIEWDLWQHCGWRAVIGQRGGVPGTVHPGLPPGVSERVVLHVRRAEHTALGTLLPVHHTRGPCQDPRLADCRTPRGQVSKALLMCCNTFNH